MTKKQLQKQIDELEDKFKKIKLDEFRFIALMEENIHICKKIRKLEQYLGIEYKVTESKREEGYVKKEVVVLGAAVGYTPKKKDKLSDYMQ